MRYLRLFMTVLPLIILISCSDDESTEPTPEHPLVGSWVLQYAIVDGDIVEADELDETLFIVELFSDFRGKAHVYEFGKFSETDDITWRTVGDNFFMTFSGDDESPPFPYELSDNQFKLSYVDGNGKEVDLIYKLS